MAGAWLPEPWASRLVREAGAKVLVDEKTLWPGGKFPTTVVIVRTQFLQQHPATVQAVLRGVLDANALAESDPAEAKAAVNRESSSSPARRCRQRRSTGRSPRSSCPPTRWRGRTHSSRATR